MVKPSGMEVLAAVLPRDRNVRRLAQGVAYGPGARHRLDIYGPSNADTPPPVLIFYYGGGWDSGRREDYALAGRAFAAAGFMTVIPDYRIFPEARYPLFLEDCALAADWVAGNIADHGGDPGRLVLAGHSAGAYNAMMIGLDRRWLAGRAYADSVRAVAGISGPYDFYPFDVEVSIRSFGEAGAARESQPVHLDLSEAPPVFLGHGIADRIVALKNTLALGKALRAAGRTVEEHHYEGAGHVWPLLALFKGVRWRLPIYHHLTGFLGRVTG